MRTILTVLILGLMIGINQSALLSKLDTIDNDVQSLFDSHDNERRLLNQNQAELEDLTKIKEKLGIKFPDYTKPNYGKFEEQKNTLDEVKDKLIAIEEYLKNK